MTGQRFGSLVVLHVATTTTRGNARLKCRCDCGMVLSVRRSWLKNGRVQSCGDPRRHS